MEQLIPFIIQNGTDAALLVVIWQLSRTLQSVGFRIGSAEEDIAENKNNIIKLFDHNEERRVAIGELRSVCDTRHRSRR